MKTKLLTVAADLEKHIAKVAKDAASLASGIQLALASAAFHAIAHGNVNPINAIFAAAGKGVRRSAMNAWLLAHAPVALQTDKDKAKEAPYVFVRDRVAELAETDKPTLEQAEAYGAKVLSVDWTSFKEPPLVPESFDVLAMLQRVVKQSKDLQAKGSKPKHGDLIAKLEALTVREEAPAPL